MVMRIQPPATNTLRTFWVMRQHTCNHYQTLHHSISRLHDTSAENHDELQLFKLLINMKSPPVRCGCGSNIPDGSGLNEARGYHTISNSWKLPLSGEVD